MLSSPGEQFSYKIIGVLNTSKNFPATGLITQSFAQLEVMCGEASRKDVDVTKFKCKAKEG